MSRPPPASRAAYRWFMPITTRFMDNDAFAHVNNVIYYSWIDTAVNRFLIDNGLLDLLTSKPAQELRRSKHPARPARRPGAR